MTSNIPLGVRAYLSLKELFNDTVNHAKFDPGTIIYIKEPIPKTYIVSPNATAEDLKSGKGYILIEKNEMRGNRIYAVWAGLGKTQYVKHMMVKNAMCENPELYGYRRAIDFDSADFKHVIEQMGQSPKFNELYIQSITNLITQNTNTDIFISYFPEVIEALAAKSIPVFIIIPTLDGKDAYLSRLQRRAGMPSATKADSRAFLAMSQNFDKFHAAVMALEEKYNCLNIIQLSMNKYPHLTKFFMLNI